MNKFYKNGIFHILSFCLIASIIVFGGLTTNQLYALSGNEFQAGRIIDDFVFFNSNSMSPDSIQQFLNIKVPVCDINGAQPYSGTTRAAYGTSRGYPPPYTCLKDYTVSTVSKPAEVGLCNGYGVTNQSAAQIIYGVAQSCGISPRVLIVLLQKEQSLITDDWPWSIQYRSATGYGCPDTAPCDSEYYGYFNQVYSAARQFKNYSKNSTNFNYRANRNSYILYNPDSNCGGSNVLIQNQATAGLYNYTPYQPNNAALNNLYGTGDSCSSYGNRNFWRIYNDWFGLPFANDTNTPHPDGTVISDGIRVYLMENGQRRHLINPIVFESYGYKWNDVKESTTGDRKTIVASAIDNLAAGTLFYSGSSPVYAMEYDGVSITKRQVSLNAFKLLGYSWNEVKSVPSALLPSTSHPTLLNSPVHPSGTLVLSASEGKIYLIEKGQRRHILGPQVFESNKYKWEKVKTATSDDLLLPLGEPVNFKKGTLLLSNGGIKLVQYNNLGIIIQPLGPWECFSDRMHYNLSDLINVDPAKLPTQTGVLFTC